MSKVYNLYLSSVDRISGDNNTAVFDINWDFLPREHKFYNIDFVFLTDVGFYTGIQQGEVIIRADFQCGSLSYNTSNKSNSIILGYAIRQTFDVTAGSKTYYAPLFSNPKKTINRPTQNIVNFKMNNVTGDELITNTSYGGTANADMTNWDMIITFEPCL